ncbi:hypothetical protein SPLC1_S030660 [Arthrospira platensis C1]|nr:hypothetical protein SPLC1_S030660 [Arthrospira platensis C1]
MTPASILTIPLSPQIGEPFSRIFSLNQPDPPRQNPLILT